MPIMHSGHVIGAVGVSGASSAGEDQELSMRAAEAASAAARDGGGKAATYFPADSIAAKFATGGLLHDTPGYKIDAGRRTAPGEVEYHEHIADIMHVMSGTATVVTGGQMIAPHTVGPGEMRAAVVKGGTRYELGAGDVLVIPPGVPHQFAAVSDPFLYLVAKVRD
jgi:glc operon protein GlcG